MGVTNAIDIAPGQRKELLGLLSRHLPGVAVWAFGSRVKWTARPDSDLDLVVFSPPEQKGHVAALKEAFEESSLPFRVDLLVWDEIPESFRGSIRKAYVVLVDESETKPPAPKNLAGMAISKRPFGELFAEPTRNGLTRPKAIRGSGTKMVNMGELFANPRIQNIAMDRVPLTDEEAKRSLLQTGDLLFARQSLVLEGAGKCSIYLGDCEPVTFESHVTRVRLDRNEADPRFYFYWLQSHAGRNAVRSIVEQGAGAAGIRGSDLQYLEVLWRPVEEQKAIADVLSSLDDKIELNRRMNETLEAMARAIFKSWFVDFDPVRAKASELIKEGVLAIGDGYRAKNDELGIEGMPFIRAAELNNGFDTVSAERLRTDRLPAAKGKHSMVGDVAFTSKGTVGRFARVSEHTEPFIYSPQICFWRSLRPEVIHPAVLYCWMRSGEFVSQIDGVAGQTDMAPYVSLRDQKAMEVPRFHESQVQVGEQIAPLLRLISEQQAECHNLATLRDTLLPKLIAGELECRHPEPTREYA